MRENSGRRAAVFALLMDQTAADTAVQRSWSAPSENGLGQGAPQYPPGVIQIKNLLVAPLGERANDHIALNDKLAVVMAPAPIFAFRLRFVTGLPWIANAQAYYQPAERLLYGKWCPRRE